MINSVVKADKLLIYLLSLFDSEPKNYAEDLLLFLSRLNYMFWLLFLLISTSIPDYALAYLIVNNLSEILYENDVKWWSNDYILSIFDKISQFYIW